MFVVKTGLNSPFLAPDTIFAFYLRQSIESAPHRSPLANTFVWGGITTPLPDQMMARRWYCAFCVGLRLSVVGRQVCLSCLWSLWLMRCGIAAVHHQTRVNSVRRAFVISIEVHIEWNEILVYFSCTIQFLFFLCFFECLCCCLFFPKINTPFKKILLVQLINKWLQINLYQYRSSHEIDYVLFFVS